MRQLPIGTVTLLSSDIEASTELLRALRPDAYAALLARHRALMRAAFRAHGGEEVDTQGDAFFVSFPRARDAVAAAVRAQRDHAAESWPDEAEVRVRIGLHTGEPTAADEGYVGLDVHRVARVMSAGHGGEILCSAATAAILDGDEPPGIMLHDLGAYELKDFGRPERLLRVLADGLPATFPPPRARRVAHPSTPRGRRWKLVGAAGAVAVVGAVALVVLTLSDGGGDGGSIATGSGTLVRIDPSRRRPAASLTAGGLPAAVAASGDTIFAALPRGRTIQRIDPSTEQTTTANTPSRVTVLLADGRSLWGYAPADDELLKLDPAIPAVTERTPLETYDFFFGASHGLARAGGSVWVGAGTRLYRIAPGDGHLVESVVSDLGARPLAADGATLWVAGVGGVAPYDVTTGTFGLTVTVDGEPLAAATGVGDAVWVATYTTAGSFVYRIDTATRTVVTAIDVPSRPVAVVAGFDAVWVASVAERLVLRIDPDTNDVTDRIELVGSPTGLAVAADGIWVSVS